MAVTLVISDSLDGAAVSDSLDGGGTGVDLGQVVNGQYAPIGAAATAQTDNEGKRSLFIRHDAIDDPITDFSIFLSEYADTGFTYGGRTAGSSSADFNDIIDLGNASGSSKNNADGLSGGVWVDFNHKVSVTNQFDFATNGIGQAGDNTVAIFGDGGTAGISSGSAFLFPSEAMVINTDQTLGGDATNGFTPTAPVDGSVGKNGDTALGDNAHARIRIYLPTSFVDGGVYQAALTLEYSSTS